MPTSVHDNWVYALAADYERRRVTLHTSYPHSQPPEYTDVVFEGVVIHHFEQQQFGDGATPANVLLDVTEADPLHVLEGYGGLLDRTKNYGWPALKYENVADLAAQLTAAGARCFEVLGSWGLCGFVFASSVEFRARPSRAEVV